MSHLFRQILAVLIFWAFPLQAALCADEGQKPGQALAIVAGASFPKDRLTPKELKGIYIGDIQILEDLWIHPIDQRENQPIRKRFLEQVLAMTRDRYIDHWNRKLFRSGGFTPLLRNNSREVIETIREQEGSVGYVWLAESQNEAGIKILLILDEP